MKMRLLSFVFVVALFSNISSAQIAAWDFTGESSPATSTADVYNAGLDASNAMTRGGGAAVSAGTNSFRTQGFGSNGIATTNTDYFQVTLSATTGNLLSLSSIDANLAGTQTYAASPGVTMQFAYSLDGTNFVLIGSPQTIVGTASNPSFITLATINLSGVAALQNVADGTTVTLRFYATGQTTGGGWGFYSGSAGSYGLAIGGTISAGADKVSASTGDWNTAGTWTPSGVPTPGQTVLIQAAHTVYTSTVVNRTTTTTVNGAFQINTGGGATGTNFTYGSTASLHFNTTTDYGVANADPYWPTTNGPFNVNVMNGGVIFGAGANRTVNGTFTTTNASVTPIGGIEFPSSTLTLNGTCRINTGGYFLQAPIYGASSTLNYNSGGTYGRASEWSALGIGTIGTTPGYPNNILLTGNTTLNYTNGATGPGYVGVKALANDLTISSGCSLYMDYGSINSGGSLVVGRNVTLGGNLSLGQDNGSDIRIGGDFAFLSGYGWLPNNRAVWFTKNGTQVLSSTGTAPTFHYLNFELASGTTLQMNTNLAVTAPLANNVISFNTGNMINLNGNALTLGQVGIANTFAGTSSFMGSTSSLLGINGVGNIGTINFVTGFQNLATLVVNRTGVTPVACTLGTPLTIATSLGLSGGAIDIGNNLLTLGANATTSGASTANYVIADRAAGSNAGLRKIFNANPAGGFMFPIGDRVASANGSEYSRMIVTSNTGTWSGGSMTVAVDDVKEPNLVDAPTDFISRYWDITTSGITSSTYLITADYTALDVNGTEANCQSNQWNGTTWLNNGAPGGTNTLSITCTTLPSVNHITKAYRGPDISIVDNPTTTNQANNATYTFASIPSGSTSTVTFTLSNIGQQPLTFTSATVTNTSGTAFSLSGAFATTSLAVGGTRTFTIQFAPVAVATYTGYIRFVTNDPDENPFTLYFSGTAITPTKEINITGAGNTLTTVNTPFGFTDTLFGVQNVSTTSAAKTYTIQNLGNVPLTVSSVVISGANAGDFSISAAPATSVPAQVGVTPGTTTFSVTFTPSAVGTRNATITVNNDDADEGAYVFYVQGTGQDAEIDVFGNGVSIASGDMTPSAVDNTTYGNVNVASGTSVRYYSISNTGAVSLTVSGITITGAHAGDFTITTAPAYPASLATDTNTIFGITFNPSANGPRNAQVNIANTDSNENPYTFAIQGNGVDFIPCALGPVETIVSQDFEVSPATPTMTYTVPALGSGVVAAPNGGTAYGVSYATLTNKYVTPLARSFQMTASNSGSKTATINFDPVNTLAYQDINLAFAMGAYTSVANGLDVGDEVIVYVSTDGVTWTKEMHITGNGDAIWDINTSTGAAYSTMYDGNNIAAIYRPATTTTKNTFTRNYTLTNLPSVTGLRVRIVFTVDRTDELWSIDNVTLTGKRAASTTWNGPSPGSWSNGAPTATVKAIINFPYNTTTGNIDACACQITSIGTVTVNANQYIDVQDNFDNGGAFTIESSGSLIQHNNDAVNTGNNVTVRRTTAGYRKFDYTYWSAPVYQPNVATTFTGWRTDYAFQFATANFMDVLTSVTNAPGADGYDDDGNAWQQINPATTNMTQAKGYAIMMPTNVAFSPTPTATVSFSGQVNNGVITIPLAQSQNTAETMDDFNLIGNPYPSALSGYDFLGQNAIATSQITGTLYFWTHNQPIAPVPGPSQLNFITADYAMYTRSGGTASGTGSAVPTGEIASGTGFFVEAATGATSALFNNSMRSKTYDNSQFFRTASPSASSQPNGQIDRIWLNFTHANGLFSQQLLAYFPNTTLGYDIAYDGRVNPSQNSVSFYSFIGEDQYRIQARPSFDPSDVVPLGYKVLAAGNYNITIAQSEGVLSDDTTDVYLEDRLLNVFHNLKESSYSFNTEAGTFNERFQLRYSNSSLGNPDFNPSNGAVIVAVSNGQIKVKAYDETIASIAVYDILGREVFVNKNVATDEFIISDAVRNQQALIVKVTLENGTVTNKKIVF